MKLDQETTRKVLELVAANAPKERAKRTKSFVQAGVGIEPNKLTVTMPAETKSESNQRDRWGKVRRTKSARKILFETMAPYHATLTRYVAHFHAGGALRVTITRLGGRSLDDDNIRGACKATRDAVAALMLADDGDPRFVWCYDMSPGGDVGVMVEIETLS